jgi:hypothetical protein
VEKDSFFVCDYDYYSVWKGSGKIMKTPCSTGCNMCGTCCVIYTIDDEKLQKASFKRCPNLVYEGNKALCSIHETKGKCQPDTCKEYDATKRQKTVWYDDRFKFYKQREFMEHWAWCSKQGYLKHLPIMQAIANKDYSEKVTEQVFRYFVHPVCMDIDGTLAVEKEWFGLWQGLKDYLKTLPDEVKSKWCAKNNKNYRKKPLQVI